MAGRAGVHAGPGPVPRPSGQRGGGEAGRSVAAGLTQVAGPGRCWGSGKCGGRGQNGRRASSFPPWGAGCGAASRRSRPTSDLGQLISGPFSAAVGRHGASGTSPEGFEVLPHATAVGFKLLENCLPELSQLASYGAKPRNLWDQILSLKTSPVAHPRLFVCLKEKVGGGRGQMLWQQLLCV